MKIIMTDSSTLPDDGQEVQFKVIEDNLTHRIENCPWYSGRFNEDTEAFVTDTSSYEASEVIGWRAFPKHSQFIRFQIVADKKLPLSIHEELPWHEGIYSESLKRILTPGKSYRVWEDVIDWEIKLIKV